MYGLKIVNIVINLYIYITSIIFTINKSFNLTSLSIYISDNKSISSI